MKFSHALVGLIFVSTVVHAQPSSNGYGKLTWGASFEEAKAAFPDFSEEEKKVAMDASLTSPEEVTRRNQTPRLSVPMQLPGRPVQLSNADGTVILLFLGGKFVGTNIVSVQDKPSDKLMEGQNVVERKLNEKLAAKYGNDVTTQVSIGTTATQWIVSFQMFSRAVLQEIDKQEEMAKAKATDELVQSLEEKLTGL